MVDIKNNRIILIIILTIALVSALFYSVTKREAKEVSYIMFKTFISQGIVKEVFVDDSPKIKVVLDNGDELITDNPRTIDFKEYLLINNVKVNEDNISTDNMIFSFIILGSLAFLIIYQKKNFTSQAEKEMANISKMDNDEFDVEIGFSDVAGNEEAKATLEEMVDFIQNPQIYRDFGARLPRGVLLYGPPGTGKTLLAKALAGEAKVPFYAVAGSDFVQVYAGLGAGRIRDLFKKAKNAGKSVIFIDEIDSIGKKRKGNDISGSEEGDRTLNALLAEMSGFKENEGIIVIAATNRIDVLDEALLRPGRFDRQIEVQLPDINARHKILQLHAQNKPLSKSLDLKKLAEETVYFSGAKLENLLNEAAMIAVKSKAKEISNVHLDKAYYKVLVGDEKMDRSYINKKDKEITAYHEAGHALVAKLVDKSNRVTKVSIIPSTRGVGGFSLNLPSDKIYRSKQDLYNNIMIALGGRAAEEIVFGNTNVTTGASSDLEKASDIALSLVGSLGMDDKFGLLNIDSVLSKNIEANNNLLERANDILEELYRETIDLISSSKNILAKIAIELLNKETIDENDINCILMEGQE